MGKTQLPPGLRFHPTDVELIMYYLKRKVLGKKLHFEGIVEVDIYKHAPWHLPDKSGWRSGDLKWYFFCPRAKKYAIGGRMNRSTDLGYWKTTGKDRNVSYNHKVVGMIKTLVFHRGKSPNGDRTDWVMYEYRLEEKELAERDASRDEYVLCAIFEKDGRGPRNGAQYGAPFCEEDWDDDGDEDKEMGGGGGQAFSAEISVPSLVVPTTQNSPGPSSAVLSEINGGGSLVSCPSAALPCATLPHAPEVVLPVSDSFIEPLEAMQFEHEDDISAMLSNFSEEGGCLPNESDKNEVVDPTIVGGDVASDPHCDGIDIYDDLGDLGSLAGLLEPGDSMTNCCNSIYQGDQMFDAQFVELIDFDAPLNVSSEPQGCSNVQAGDLYASKNFCNNSGQLYYSNASSMVTQCSPSTRLPGWLYSLNHMVNSAGADANQGCDIYGAAGSSSEYPTFSHGTQVQRTQSELQSERRDDFHHFG